MMTMIALMLRMLPATNSARMSNTSIGVVDNTRRIDLQNLLLLWLSCMLVLAIVPPVREYPINDDWTYAQSVADILNWSYTPHDWAQAIALGHNIWGGVFAFLFGQSFTILSIANLFVSTVGVTIFYMLLRHLDVSPGYALLGAALLRFNPIYFYLSYSFMTDVTFLTYLLAACLCYVRGLQDRNMMWLWLGGLATALAYLTRQYGLILVVAILAYLWWSRRFTRSNIIAACSIPVAVAIIYTIWARTFPEPLISYQMGTVRSDAFSYPVEALIARLQNIALVVATPSLCLLPVLWRPRRLLFAMPIFGLMVFFLARNLAYGGTMFPIMGNIVDHTGMNLGDLYMPAVWGEWVWTLLGIAGALVFSFFVTGCIEQVWHWLRKQPWKTRSDSPALMVYLVGGMLAAIVFVVTPVLFDRYLLPLLTVLILVSLRRRATEGAPAPRMWKRWVVLIPLALFAIAGQRDFMAHSSARWHAAERLVEMGISRNHVDAGMEWQGWYLYYAGADQVRAKGDLQHVPFPPEAVLDPLYAIADTPRPGYVEIGSVPYASWLDGGRIRTLLLLRRK